MTISQLYTSNVNRIINTHNQKRENNIFVFLGVIDVIDETVFKKNIVDYETFRVEGNQDVFSIAWSFKVSANLFDSRGYKILSYAQFSYLLQYLNPELFQDKVVLVRDNLRSLYPLDDKLFQESLNQNNSEERSKEIPVYQAEQIKIADKYYYTVNLFDFNWVIEDLFVENKKIKSIKTVSSEYRMIDVLSKYSIDLFYNECINSDTFGQKACVKVFNKHPDKEKINITLERFNYVYYSLGGELYSVGEESVRKTYDIKERSKELLLKYWGENAEFRQMMVYKDPTINKELVSISQGLIVDTIIDEYEKSNTTEGDTIRDLFLTAPTGSGKSLLFQLPAFYVSSKGDMTIIVSPLIALMKDQVMSIKSDRGFEKVAYLNSELTLIERENIIEQCKNSEIDLLYLSPELLLSYDISFFVGQRKLGLLVIDEAHLITTWGRDFRVDYWYLGSYIRKIRKYNDYNFPVVAVTATAVYGGVNDMVFDSIDSLAMQNPFIYIGQVKREDITFVINNHERFGKNNRRNKTLQTVDFIKKIADIGAKTIIYTPYTTQITDLSNALDDEKIAKNIVSYSGSLDQNLKGDAYTKFKNGDAKIMICTKAFGMGVDISDIEVVYHHAPSGLLPDYIQEIGRVARDSRIKGFAALDYSIDDLNYSKALQGMSSIKLYQLREMLKKIFNLYLKNKRSRNLLVSSDDFGYIFNEYNSDQKVMTSLMMIEKDYLAKYRYNVLIARPKKLFSTVFSRVTTKNLAKLQKYYPNTYRVIGDYGSFSKNIELDLNMIWKNYHSDMSFPLLKKSYYSKELFEKEKIEVIPLLRFSYNISFQAGFVQTQLKSFFDSLKKVFTDFFKKGTYMKMDTIKNALIKDLPGLKKLNEITDFIFASFATQIGKYDRDAFIGSRTITYGTDYRIFSLNFQLIFDSIQKLFQGLFPEPNQKEAVKYIPKEHLESTNYIRLGYFLEMLDLGTFEVQGGDNPMIFIRINDPTKIQRDAHDKAYQNGLLSATLNKFKVSCELFDYFFLSSLSNEERWDFIEDFFIKTIKEKRILNISSQPKQNALSTDTSKNNEILTTSKNTEDNFSAKTMSLNSSKTNTRSSIELGCRVFNTELGEGVVQSYSSSQNKYLVRFGNKTKLLSSNLLKVVSKKRSSTFGSPLKQTTVSEKIVIPEDSGVISYRWTVAKSIIDLNTKMAYIRSNNDIKMYIIPLYGINVIALDIPSELDSSCIVSVEMFFNLKTIYVFVIS